MVTVAVVMDSSSWAHVMAAAISNDPAVSATTYASIPDLLHMLDVDRPNLAVVEVSCVEGHLGILSGNSFRLPLILIGGEPAPGVIGRNTFVTWASSVSDLVSAISETLHGTGYVDAGARLARLSPREAEVLLLLARGYSKSEIAFDLYVSQNTVRTHVGQIRTKLEVRSQAEAVALAWAAGLRSQIRQTAGCA